MRLGAVVPPEDPEDWTRPLTWVAALGMLAAPIVAAAWFLALPPTAEPPGPMTLLLAATLVAGASATGATQLGAVRAASATLGAALFAALGVVVAAALTAGDGQPGAISPSVSHATTAVVAGLAGAALAALVAWVVARARPRLFRFALAAGPGVVAAIVVAGAVLAAPPPAQDAVLAPGVRTCELRVAGHVVTVTYPGDWSAHAPDEGAGCVGFAERPLQDASSVQIGIGAAGGGPEPITGSLISRREMLVAGRPALRVSYLNEGGDPRGQRVAYNISLGETLESGPVIIASTDSSRPGDFERNVEVLDAMMSALRIARE